MKETKTKTLTQERLKELLNYDPKSGLFTWETQTSHRITVGMVAGSLAKDGYVRVRVDNKIYLAHRLAFLFMTGEFPGRWLHVDHVDHVKDNNRFSNLRIVTRQENSKNVSMRKDNSSGCVGVYWYKAKKEWRSRIKINGKDKHLGTFDDKNDAIKARKAAELKYGFHPNHGKVKL